MRLRASIFAILLASCTPEVTDSEHARTPPVMVPPPGGSDASTFRERVFYELWVRSFQDSDGDGIGDIPGLIDRLDELADMGIGGIWLMPTFPSPLADSGYDVADYTAVHPDYGTLEDMKRLVVEAHKRGILVYLDMVFNHTSDRHAWFQSALTGSASPYFDYFVWSPTPTTRCTDVIPGPFGTDRWTYVEDAGMYYFHQFYPRQPDLNFQNPKVHEELVGVLDFWLDRGIDGFRFDVPDRYYESGNRCAHLPETVEFHAKLRETISGIGTLKRGFVGEIWGLDRDVLPFFGPRGNPMIFNFGFMYALYGVIAGGETPAALRLQVDKMVSGLPSESRWSIFLGNHDTPRFAEVVAGDAARLRLGHAVVLTLPMVPFVWMGDELGLRMGTDYKVDSRDGARAPYPWVSGEEGHGFTSAGAPHMAFSPSPERLAFDVQRYDPRSVLNYTRALIAVRNLYPALHAGEYETVHLDERVWVYRRWTKSQQVWVAHNFSRETARAWSSPIKFATIDLLTDDTFEAGGSVTLDPGQTRILTPQK